MSSSAKRSAAESLPGAEKIGEGTHGFVCSEIDSNTGATIAVKRLKHTQDGISLTGYREMALLQDQRLQFLLPTLSDPPTASSANYNWLLLLLNSANRYLANCSEYLCRLHYLYYDHDELKRFPCCF